MIQTQNPIIIDPFSSFDYSLGLAIFFGCLCGSYLGVHFSDRIGNLWIKRFIFVVLTAMILKMSIGL